MFVYFGWLFTYLFLCCDGTYTLWSFNIIYPSQLRTTILDWCNYVEFGAAFNLHSDQTLAPATVGEFDKSLTVSEWKKKIISFRLWDSMVLNIHRQHHILLYFILTFLVLSSPFHHFLLMQQPRYVATPPSSSPSFNNLQETKIFNLKFQHIDGIIYNLYNKIFRLFKPLKGHPHNKSTFYVLDPNFFPLFLYSFNHTLPFTNIFHSLLHCLHTYGLSYLVF